MGGDITEIGKGHKSGYIRPFVRKISSSDRVSRIIRIILIYVLLCIGAIIMLLPFLWMISTSFKLPQDVNTIYPKWIPSPVTLTNYTEALKGRPFGLYFINSLVVTISIVIGSVITSCLGGYAFAKFQFPGRTFLFFMVLSALMIPDQIIMIPLFLLIKKFGWIDSYQGLIVPWLTSVIGIFFMRQFMLTIPDEILEAAEIDGASEFKKFWYIVLPNSRSAMASVALFMFFLNWNELFWPLLVVNSTNMRTLPLGLALFSGKFTVEYGPLMAASLMVVAPVIIVFIIAQKFVTEGLMTTGLKF